MIDGGDNKTDNCIRYRALTELNFVQYSCSE